LHGIDIDEKLSLFALATWCPVTNILKPENMAQYSSRDTLSEFSNGYENTKGVSFLSNKPTIRAYFNAPASISTVALQPTYNKSTTNIIKFGVVFVTMDGKPYVDPVTGKVLTLTTADGDSTLTVQTDLINNLKGVEVTVLKTSGGMPVWFRLKVLGCYKPRKFPFLK